MTSIKAEEEAPTSIWQELDDWARSFKPWQRFILWRAIQSATLNDGEVDTAFELFLHDNALADAPDPPVELPQSLSGRPSSSESSPVILAEIRDPVGINALPTSAALNFSPGLTVIYGRNGAGKSGFSRIISNIVFSRSRHEILPNVYETDQPDQNATIVASDGASHFRELTLAQAIEDAELKRLTLFDSAVARTHLVEQTALGFKPTGFDVFAEMARVYRLLDARLDQEIGERRRENPCAATFTDRTSAVAEAVRGLGPRTDPKAIKDWGVFGDTEKGRLQEIESQIQQLQSESPAGKIKSLTDAQKEITNFVGRIRDAKGKLGSDARNEFQAQLDQWVRRARAVTESGAESFRCDELAHVGSPEWERFIASAHELAGKEDTAYPKDGDHCLLCRQPLGEPAIALMHRLWSFLSSDVRRQLDEASSMLDSTAESLAGLPLNTITDGTVLRASLHELDPALCERATGVETELRDYAAGVVSAINSGEEATIPALELRDDPTDELGTLLEQIEADLERLTQRSVSEAIDELTKERSHLEDRKLLSGVVEQALQVISDYAWADKAAIAQRLLNTRPLTEKETDLFNRVIAEGYKRRLQIECEQLDCWLPIELRALGRRGETLRSLEVQGGHRPDTVFSEGEQRAVSLADFMTEVHLNPSSAGIVLDDPVTSQDHQRKELFARRLVGESKIRQVIIFTHDLVFLTMLLTAADEADIDPLTHWIERDSEGRPGQVSLDDCPASTPQYRTTKKAKETLAESKKVSGSERLRLVQRGMAELRRTVEEVVPHHLFKQVVNRWTDRIIVTALKRVNWDQDAVAEIEALYEELSAIIEGHTHTEERTGAPAEPADLERLIERVDGLINRIKKDRT